MFGAYADYYDFLYLDKDYPAEARYVDALIQRLAPGSHSILDLGCGTGAHAAEFAALGYTVHGVDLSTEMLQHAQTRQAQLAPGSAARLSFAKGDVRSFRAGRRFDVVTALFHVVSYQVDDDDLTQTFATAAAHLEPGGIFLFDCWYGPGVLNAPPEVRSKRTGNASIQVLRTATPHRLPGRNVTEVAYCIQVTDLASGETREFHERHRMRHLFRPELEAALHRAGLSCESGEEWGSGKALSSSTWSALFVVRHA
jgi:SAM-dependent methyltransferase